MSAIAKLLDGTAEVLDEAHELDLPVDPDDVHELLHSVDRLLAAGVKLQRHLAYHPEAKVDRHGRCHQCGRLLAMPPRPRNGLFGGDGERGCLAVPASVIAHTRWLVNPAMSIPAFGKALWMACRKRGAA